MTEQINKQPDPVEQYGQQGNEGQYGQGQYTLEGKPDPHGPQAQQIPPDPTVTENASGQEINQDAYSRQNDLEEETVEQEYGTKRQLRDGEKQGN